MEINHISDISWPSFDEGNEFTRRKSLALVSKIYHKFLFDKQFIPSHKSSPLIVKISKRRS